SQDGPAATATFNWPWNLDVDASGRVYVADYLNNKIRLIENGQVSTFAGTGAGGALNGPANAATFSAPHDVAVGLDGTVYVADTNAHRIRMIKAGVVSTLAGDGTEGFRDGPAAQAQFNVPYCIAVDAANRVYTRDSGEPRVRLIENGQVTTLAGDGQVGVLDGPAASAQFVSQGFLAVDSMGKVFTSDIQAHRIRLIENGQVSTYAGTGAGASLDGPSDQAAFNWPAGIALDSQGRLFVAEFQGFRVRLIFQGEVKTLAGDGTEGFADGPAEDAQFNMLTGVAVGPDGKVYIAESFAHRVRVFTPAP
ncbi:MAG: hypothetical protein JRH20_30935, partial [Deltaproteobacteria bacterium]|nr:hypothetical protein [Deltaproteobacteria bacterium]